MKTKQAAGRKKNPLKRYVSELALKHLELSLHNNPPTFKYTYDYFIFFLDIFYRLETNNKNLRIKEDSNYAAHSCEYFKSVITDGTYAKHRNYLKKIGILLVDWGYKENEAMGYKYNPTYESNLVTVMIQPDSPIWKNIIQNSNNKRSHKAKAPFFKSMEMAFRDIDYDYKSAEEFLLQQHKNGVITTTELSVRHLCIKRFVDRDFFFKRNDTNYRIDSNLTNLKRELKNFIIGGYTCIDLRNSQPFLFNYILNLYLTQSSLSTYNPPFNPYSFCSENNMPKPLKLFIDKVVQLLIKRPNLLNKKEIERWFEATSKGKLYEIFMDELGVDRDKAKELMLCVMYSPNSSKIYKDDKKLFCKVFPTIGKFIFHLKESKYKELSIAMQSLESHIFIDNISQRLVELGIIPYTIHDSLIVKSTDLEKTIAVVEEVFLKYFNVMPSFERKELKPDSRDVIRALTEKQVVKEKKKKKIFRMDEYLEFQDLKRQNEYYFIEGEFVTLHPCDIWEINDFIKNSA